MMIVSSVLLLLSLALSQIIFRPRWLRSLAGILSVLLVVLTAIEMVSRRLSGNSFNEAIVFHLHYGMQDVGIADFKDFIIIAVSAFVIALGAVLFLMLKKPYAPWAARVKLPEKYGSLALLGMLMSALCAHPAAHSLAGFLLPKQVKAPLLSFYTHPQELTPLPRMPNLVWIYAESLERTYMDESLFPGLTPNLHALERDSLSFSNIQQAYGTGWTIGGMVASQCGVPLVTTGGGGNSLNSMPYFLPSAICLGDLLRNVGYNMHFLGGASLAFAGKGKFYKTHGFHEVLGRSELSGLLEDQSYASPWGLHDDTLFDLVKQKFASLKSSHQPFALFTLTLDTHHPAGHVSRACGDIKYGNGSNPMLNAIHCSDKLIGDLVANLRQQDEDGQTLIVVSSDHLAMPNTATGFLEQRQRRNTAIFSWPGHAAPTQIDKPASTLSLGVTALNVMGFDIKELGLGRSLIADTQTLVESDPENFNVVLESWEKEFRKLWQLPEKPKKVKVNARNSVVFLNGLPFSLPVLIDLDEADDAPEPLRLWFDDPDLKLADALPKVDRRSHIIWVDSCQIIKGAIKNEGDESSDWCLWDNRSDEIQPVLDTLDFLVNNS